LEADLHLSTRLSQKLHTDEVLLHEILGRLFVMQSVATGVEHSSMFKNIFKVLIYIGERDGVVVEALRYKPEGRGFDSRRCHWIFSLQ
jgi:hypothetical protein